MGLWKASPEEVRLEATVEDSQRWCRRDVVRQTVPNTGSGDRESSIANGYGINPPRNASQTP